MNLAKNTRNTDNWFPTIFDELLKPNYSKGYNAFNSHLPAVNIKEEKDSFEVELAVPGKKKSDFNIELDNKVLTISSEENIKDKSKDTDKDEKYSRKEFCYSSFERSFTLPDIVDESKIQAVYKDGVLKINIPKLEESKLNTKQKIAIS